MLARLNTNAETQNLRWDSDFWVTGSGEQKHAGSNRISSTPLLCCFVVLSALCKLLEETWIRGFSKQTKPALDKNHTGNLCIKVQTEDNRGMNYLKASQGPSLFAPVC